MRTKPAAVLQALMEDLWSNAHGKKPHPKASLEGDRRVIRFATAELRALLAVYGATQAAITKGYMPAAPWTHAMRRAVARVERMSDRGAK